MARILPALTAFLALVAPASAAPIGLDGSGYLALADRMQLRLDDLWSERLGRYQSGGGGTTTVTNANLLLTHSVAAREGHHGPSRDDHRARLIARFLVDGPVWVERVPKGSGTHGHAPAWVNAPNSPGQHLVFDAEVVDGLVHAYRARKELDLPERTVALIRDRIHRLARGPYWRYPALRLNQINWYALVYAADAEVNGNRATLARAYGGNLDRFVAGVRGTARAAGNLGPGLRFHYLPGQPRHHPMNVDSAEYANIVLSFTRFYRQARAAGMPALPGTRLGLLRSWVRRSLAGYWTHGGYMNWDSGLGFERWHQAKKLGLTQQALIGVASARALQPTPAWGGWAKDMLDRSLVFYERQAARGGGLPDPVFFGITMVPQGPGSARMAAARIQANAARAIAAGLGETASAEPPALYAYDPDIGRLAVTTPQYNTAVVAVNQGAFPYGGLELARLFDGRQEVLANVGGRAPAAFGLLVRRPDGRRLFASQNGRSAVSSAVTPLRLMKAPLGTGVKASSAKGRAYAGAFTDLRAAGSVRTGGFTAVTRHRFTRDWIETRWSLERSVAGRVTTDVLFPSWGGGAKVFAVLRDGTERRVTGARLSLRLVAHFRIESERAGYKVVPRLRPAGAAAHIVATHPQSSAPRPGPTLAIQLGRETAARSFAFAARIIP